MKKKNRDAIKGLLESLEQHRLKLTEEVLEGVYAV